MDDGGVRGERAATVSLVLDDGMSEEEFMAWLASLDTSEDVGEQG